MSSTIRRRDPRSFWERVFPGLLALFVVAAGVDVWASAAVGARISGRALPPVSPFTLFARLMQGSYAWPGPAATAALFVLPVCCGAAVGFPLWYRIAGPGRRPAIDAAARHLAARAPRSRPETLVSASLLVKSDRPVAPGLLVGNAVGVGRREVWASWEDMHFDIWGPRTGKTTSRAIPAALAAPGALVVTSNKRDIVDATRGLREKRGPVWVFDPQNQAGAPPTWWWNPLSFIGDNVRMAGTLVAIMAEVNRGEHVRSDGYFEPAAQSLLTHMLLAASVDDRPVTDVYRWVLRPDDLTPVRILQDRGHHRSAAAIESMLETPGPQRLGIYGTARQLISFLADADIVRWITPGDGRPCLDTDELIASGNGTVYLLSEESSRMAAPVIVALTTALAFSAEGIATENPSGRLSVPAVFVLDEAANVCPWSLLPGLYSHYGSRGIIMMTIVQSWAQGVEAWGADGMRQMWDAASVRVYGGGGADMDFLGDVSQGAGVFEAMRVSLSHKAMQLFGRTISHETTPEMIFSRADLASLPRGRALVRTSGGPLRLVRTVPWWEGPYADEVRASLARYAPTAPAV